VHTNTESGIFIDSPGLARELAGLMNRDMDPVNAWQVRLDANGKPYWTNSDETVERQPARNFFQRIMDVVFRVFPKDYY
jgi:phosphatidylserine/phosphatidylglycerophosphate/cardiolipin synthase-like enzyme